MTKIGLALGGGGAKGLAHLPFLEVFDEMGLRPHAMAGTSIGALVGVAYAAGKTASDIQAEILRLAGHAAQGPLGALRKLSWISLFGVDFTAGGLVNIDAFMDAYIAFLGVEKIEDLEIPIRLVASDFWKREEVVFSRGEIRRATRASISLPGLFKPVMDEGRVLIDGGCVNPVPFDELDSTCDITIAIDVIGQRSAGPDQVPNVFEAVFNAYQIMEKSITREKLERQRPTLYLEPEIRDVGVLDFDDAVAILEQAEQMKQAFRDDLERLLSR